MYVVFVGRVLPVLSMRISSVTNWHRQHSRNWYQISAKQRDTVNTCRNAKNVVHLCVKIFCTKKHRPSAPTAAAGRRQRRRPARRSDMASPDDVVYLRL